MSKVMQAQRAEHLGDYFTEKWERLCAIADPNESIDAFCVVTPTTWVNGPLLDGMVQVRIARDEDLVQEQIEIQSPLPLEGVRLPEWFGSAQPLTGLSRPEAPFLSLSNEYAFVEGEESSTSIGQMLAELIAVLVPLSEAARVPVGWKIVREERLDSATASSSETGDRVQVRVEEQQVCGLRDELEAASEEPIYLFESGMNARALSVGRTASGGYHLVGWLPRAIYLDVVYEASVGLDSDPMNSEQFDEYDFAEIPLHLVIEIEVAGAGAAESEAAAFFKGVHAVEMQRASTPPPA